MTSPGQRRIGGPGIGSQIGQVLNNTYRITRKIADGGMGTVCEAVHLRLPSKRYAVKLLHPRLARSKELLARFRREAEITTSLGHPNIVEVLDFYYTSAGQPYIVMEYLEGVTLQRRLDEDGPVAPAELARVAQQVGGALQAAHDRRVVHRDLKPDNIFLLPGGLVKVLDFGVSKIRGSNSIVTREDVLLGTTFYMSPEQASGAHDQVDHTTDVFSLGAICYQALTGVRPFDGRTTPAVLLKIIHEDPVLPSEQVPWILPGVDAVLLRALAKDKRARFQRVGELTHALARAVGVSSTGVPGPSIRDTIPEGSGHWGGTRRP